MTTTKGHRINARLAPDSARKVSYLERYTSMSTTEVLRESIDRFYAAVMREGEDGGTAEKALAAAGFVGCASGLADLSSSYKGELGRSLGKKT